MSVLCSAVSRFGWLVVVASLIGCCSAWAETGYLGGGGGSSGVGTSAPQIIYAWPQIHCTGARHAVTKSSAATKFTAYATTDSYISGGCVTPAASSCDLTLDVNVGDQVCIGDYTGPCANVLAVDADEITVDAALGDGTCGQQLFEKRYGIYVSPYGDVLFNLNEGVTIPHTVNASDNAQPVDFWWDSAHRRLQVREILARETGDPGRVQVGRAGDSIYPDGASPATAAGANIGTFEWACYAGAGTGWEQPGAKILGRQLETCSDTTLGMEMEFFTIASTTATPRSRMRIRDDGDVEIGCMSGSCSGQNGVRYQEQASNGTNYVKVVSPAALGGNFTVSLKAETGNVCTDAAICGSAYQAGPLSGDVVTSGAVATIQANAVALATDTTGNFLASMSVTSPIVCTGCTAAEGGTPALSIGTGTVGPTEIASTAVTPGSYTATDLTVDADGRITAASSGAGGAGDVTAVGPGCATGACFTDGLATTGTTLFVWEGTTVDTNEITIAMPTADPAADKTITFPNETGTICTTGSVCSGYAASAGSFTVGVAAATAITNDTFLGPTMSNATEANTFAPMVPATYTRIDCHISTAAASGCSHIFTLKTGACTGTTGTNTALVCGILLNATCSGSGTPASCCTGSGTGTCNSLACSFTGTASVAAGDCGDVFMDSTGGSCGTKTFYCTAR